MGERQLGGRYKELINRQINLQKAMQLKIHKEMQKITKHGNRANIFYKPSDITKHRRKIEIKTPEKQMQLFFGWIKQTADKRSRVLGKSFINYDIKVERITPLQQYQQWLKEKPLVEEGLMQASKFDYKFDNMTEADVMLLNQQEDEKWSELPDEEIYGLFPVYDASEFTNRKQKDFDTLMEWLNPTEKNTYKVDPVVNKFKSDEEYYNEPYVIKEAKKRLESMTAEEVSNAIDSGKYVMRVVETKKFKLIDTFNTKFFTPDYFFKKINELTIDRIDQFFLTSVVYRKPGEDVNSKIRKKERVTELPLLFAELDYYKMPELEGMKKEKVIKMIEQLLREVGFPPFTQVVFSGRGIHLYWLINPIGEFKMKKWDFMQKYLNKLLKRFGADGNALDAVRVLRLIGSINGKNNEIVTGYTYTEARYDFDTLFEMYCQEEWDKQKAERLEKRLNASKNKVVSLINNEKWLKKNGYVDEEGNFTEKYDKSAYSPNKSFFARYHELILSDLATLITLRDGNMNGYRNALFFVTYNYALRVAKTKEAAVEMVKEIYDLLTDVEFNFEKYLYHAKSAEKGHEKWLKNKAEGYNYSAKRLIELFDITRDEMHSLFTLITDDIKQEHKKRNDRERVTKKRRVNGVKSHKEKKENTLQKILDARDELLSQGKKASHKAISELCGIAKSTVGDYLRSI